jgi:hypothetical protein
VAIENFGMVLRMGIRTPSRLRRFRSPQNADSRKLTDFKFHPLRITPKLAHFPEAHFPDTQNLTAPELLDQIT